MTEGANLSRRVGVLGLLTLYLVLLFGIPTRLVFAPLGSAGAPSLLFGLVCAFAWLLAQLWRATSEPGARRPVRFALACFLACVGVSYVLAMIRPIEADESSQADVALLTMLSLSGVFLVAHDGLSSIRDITTMVGRFAVAGGFMATLGLAQYVTRQSLVDRLSVPGLTATSGTGVAYRNGLVRVAGTATHPIEFGALLTMLLPIALHHALHSHDRGRLRRWFPAVAIFAALALSGSRSAYIGLCIVLVVLLLGWPRRMSLRVGTAAAGIVLLMCVGIPPLFRSVRAMFVSVPNDPSIASRTESYAIAGQFFERWPVFGRGLGTFLPKYRIFDNNYLGLLVSVGVVGTVSFVAILVVTTWLLLRRRRRWADEPSRDLALSLAAAVLAGAASLAFFDAFSFPMTMGTLFLTLGIAGAYLSARGRGQLPPETPAVPASRQRPGLERVTLPEPRGPLTASAPLNRADPEI